MSNFEFLKGFAISFGFLVTAIFLFYLSALYLYKFLYGIKGGI